MVNVNARSRQLSAWYPWFFSWQFPIKVWCRWKPPCCLLVSRLDLIGFDCIGILICVVCPRGRAISLEGLIGPVEAKLWCAASGSKYRSSQKPGSKNRKATANTLAF